MSDPVPPPTEQSTLSRVIPPDLPPEEKSAADEAGVDDLALDEQEFLKKSLSGHTVQAAKLRNDLVQAYIENLNADRTMRQTYAGRILRFLEFYAGGVAVILLLAGFHPFDFTLEQGVTTTLVGSTAAAAIGLVGFIARGLFRPVPEPSSISSKHD